MLLSIFEYKLQILQLCYADSVNMPRKVVNGSWFILLPGHVQMIRGIVIKPWMVEIPSSSFRSNEIGCVENFVSVLFQKIDSTLKTLISYRSGNILHLRVFPNRDRAHLQ